MARNDNRRNGGSKQDEAARYRRAADDALQQLDWAIGYLHGIRKTKISQALSRNRSYIRSNLLDREEEPLPSSAAPEE